MRKLPWITIGFLMALTVIEAQAQRVKKHLAEHPQAIGDAGIAWYTTWEGGLAEAKRSNRPIFFMAAATCKVPGAF